MTFGINWRLIVLAVLAWFLLGMNVGCETDAEKLRVQAQVITDFAAENGIEAEGELYIVPNGSVSFGPALLYNNGSYLKMRLRADPAKAKLQKAATTSVTVTPAEPAP